MPQITPALFWFLLAFVGAISGNFVWEQLGTRAKRVVGIVASIVLLIGLLLAVVFSIGLFAYSPSPIFS